jgi:Protein of unknown function (DUF2877)
VPTLPAHLVATPVLERLAGEHSGVVLGAGATAAWIDLDGFVVAITTREVPLLPNAVALTAGSGSLQRAGGTAGAVARFAPGRVDLGALRVSWDAAAPPTWDPTIPVAADAGPEALAGHGAALVDALGGHGSAGRIPELVRGLARIGLSIAADPEGATGLTLLLHAVRRRDPEPAARAAHELLGRGPGLTPEGDDLLAAVAGTLAVLGPAAGWDRSVLAGFLTSLVTPARERTTALSVTLLQLAARRQLAEPAGRLLDLDPEAGAAWAAALSRLERLGHGSGRAYAAGIAATTSLLAAGSPVG